MIEAPHPDVVEQFLRQQFRMAWLRRAIGYPFGDLGSLAVRRIEPCDTGRLFSRRRVFRIEGAGTSLPCRVLPGSGSRGLVAYDGTTLQYLATAEALEALLCAEPAVFDITSAAPLASLFLEVLGPHSPLVAHEVLPSPEALLRYGADNERSDGYIVDAAQWDQLRLRFLAEHQELGVEHFTISPKYEIARSRVILSPRIFAKIPLNKI